MADLYHQFASDLLESATGDLACADGPALGQQRVLRRLLTNPGDYIWQLDYGAGLGRFVGETVDPVGIRGVIRSQIFRESAVARSPEPRISVESGTSVGEVFVTVSYADAGTGDMQVLSFSIGGT